MIGPARSRASSPRAIFGLRRNVSEGLDWVFAQTEEAIILEDDCLPDPSFFPFCDELLERYRDDATVGMICGTNLAPRQIIADSVASYYFSRYCYIWGWATWRRAWRCYDREVKEWPSLGQNGWLNHKLATSTAINFRRRHFDDCYGQHPDGLNTWDVQLVFAFWRHQMHSIVAGKPGQESWHRRQRHSHKATSGLCRTKVGSL